MGSCKMKNEIYKDIVGYEGLYKISNYGNVFSCITNKILKPSFHTKTKHLGVTLCKDKKYKRFQIHRLVAQAFIPNPLNLPCINHKDEDPTNNYEENLEWCDYEYNNQYSAHKHKGKIPWNKGKKVKPFTEEHKRNMSNSHKGTKLSTKTKEKISNSLKSYYMGR